MTEDYQSGASDTPVPSSEQALSELTPQDLMALPRKERPTWMVTRYPVSVEEFQQLNEEAVRPDQEPLGALRDVAEADVDIDTQPSFAMADLAEDVPVTTVPTAGAPATTASFQGIPATGWRPSDTSIAVGQSNVLLAVNTDLAGYSKGGALQFPGTI